MQPSLGFLHTRRREETAELLQRRPHIYIVVRGRGEGGAAKGARRGGRGEGTARGLLRENRAEYYLFIGGLAHYLNKVMADLYYGYENYAAHQFPPPECRQLL